MKNKQTAVQKLATIIEDRIGISTMANQNESAIVGYQMALVGIKLDIQELLKIESQQLEHCAMHFAAYAHTCLLLHKPMDGENEFEKYYFETYGKDN
jgi:hypothetical protein